jgi:hypothetical protein
MTANYYFESDEAFPLKINLMTSYPKRMLTNKRCIFNYRLSPGQKRVECAFGILNAKFKIFEGPICCKEETVNSVVKASVVLHNFVRIREGLAFYERAENYAVNEVVIF